MGQAGAGGLGRSEVLDMWTARSTQILDGRGLRFGVSRGSSPVTYAEVLGLWRDNDEFRRAFIGWLAAVPFAAFRWETPPISAATSSRSFEFVILDSPELSRVPDADAFSEHFARPGKASVLEFENVGRAAIMVVPRPLASPSAYGHLAAFVRQAPVEQKHALWELVGAAMIRRVGSKPVWLSTAGAGVSWLHIRLDDRPKYYGYEPFRSTAPQAPAACAPRAAPS